MSHDLISKKTRYEVQGYLVNWTLREIEIEFDSADIPLADGYTPNTSGQRRSLVQQYYHSLDFSTVTPSRKKNLPRLKGWQVPSQNSALSERIEQKCKSVCIALSPRCLTTGQRVSF